MEKTNTAVPSELAYLALSTKSRYWLPTERSLRLSSHHSCLPCHDAVLIGDPPLMLRLGNC